MALPGSYDFARTAWFAGIGGVGRAIGPVTVLEGKAASGIDGTRHWLGRHIREQLPGPAGTIASTLANGDQNAIAEEDAEAMRRSGLAHLLSVSGLHITAVIGAAMLLTLRLLALSPQLAAPFAACSRDACVAMVAGEGRMVRVLATRSSAWLEWDDLVRSCAKADIVVSDRWLPDGCAPKWLKLDRKSLERTGGVSIYLGEAPRIDTVAERVGEHPWASSAEKAKKASRRGE